MYTILGFNQIQFEGFYRFIGLGLTEELYKFPKMKDINQEIEFQFFVKTYQLVELVIKERDVYESLPYLLNAKPLLMQQLYRKDRKKKK